MAALQAVVLFGGVGRIWPRLIGLLGLSERLVLRVRQQPRHPNQIVGGHRECELERVASGAPQLRLGEPATVLAQPKASSIRFLARWLAA